MRLIKNADKQLRAEFELFIKTSAEEAGLNEPSLERDSEHPESYDNPYVRAAWSGFLNGAMRSDKDKRRRQVGSVLPERMLYTSYIPGVIPDNAADVSAYRDGWNACINEAARLNASPVAPKPTHSYVADVRVIALELCDVIENKNDLQLHKWAIKSAYLVSKLRKLLDDAP